MHKFNLVVAALATVAIQSAHGQEKQTAVFDVRKPIALKNNQKVHKDFYINAGNEKGIKVGMVITVKRSQALYDAYQNKSPGDLVIPIGKLKIIHVQKGVSVGRMHRLFSRNGLPIVDYDYIMVGDRVDLNTMAWEKKKSAQRKLKSTDSADFASKKPDPKNVILPSLQ